VNGRPETDAVVVGAGIVGLAAAAALAVAGRSVVVIERNAAIAREITARNSEVIHAGIYYPTGSLKAELCVAGRQALYERCAKLGVPHRNLGKLIVATNSDELATLETIAERAHANGVPEVCFIDAAEVRRREPAVRAVAALDSPVTGIVDAHALALSFAAEAEAHGAVLVMQTEVVEIERCRSGYRVAARGADGERSDLRAAAVINAAGLAGDHLAACAGFDVDARGYRLHPCKGDYFSLAPGAPVRVERLVYPVPAGAGLGVHATLDLGERIRFGPDTEYVTELRYDVDPGKAVAFSAAIRRYLPAIDAAWLAPDYAGIRPKLAGPGEAFRDFVVAEESDAGWPGFVNLIGIESPGLTASPAIGARVVELLAGLA
jgi:L-2-hydroxyglutarate oxidase LhgO